MKVYERITDQKLWRGELLWDADKYLWASIEQIKQAKQPAWETRIKWFDGHEDARLHLLISQTIHIKNGWDCRIVSIG